MLRLLAGALALAVIMPLPAKAQTILDNDGRWRPYIHAHREAASRSHDKARGRVHRRGYVRHGAVRANARRIAAAAVEGGYRGGQSAAHFTTLAVEHSRPADCYGIPWCGCWLKTVFGMTDRALNLAIAWAHVGSPASPQTANVVVWRHHVGQLLAYEPGRILIRSGNDRGAVRTRWVSPHILGGVVAWRRV